MGQYNSTLPSRSLHLHPPNTRRPPATAAPPDDDDNSLSNSTTSIMGAHPPPLYDAALIGNWSRVLSRLSATDDPSPAISPANLLAEVLYQDKSLNSAVHLACRRQPPSEVISALLHADTIANAVHITQHGHPAGVYAPLQLAPHTPRDRRLTVDGLTALHFACYCGANSRVVHMLIEHDERIVQSCVLQRRMEAHHSHSARHGSGGVSLVSSMTLGEDGGVSEGDTRFTMAASLRDRRGRTPLHCACSGFRTSHRPSIIRSLLRADPTTACVPDEKGRTPLSLMYADYAEEIEEVLAGGVSVEDARRACGLVNAEDGNKKDKGGKDKGRRGGGAASNANMAIMGSGATSKHHYSSRSDRDDGPKLQECWIILNLLLRAAHLGSVPEEHMEAEEMSLNHHAHNLSSSSSKLLRRADSHKSTHANATIQEEPDESDTQPPPKPQHYSPNHPITNEESKSVHPPFPTFSTSSKTLQTTTKTSNEVDLNYTPFQILHAASACIYTIPRGFFRLILKVVDAQKAARERDSEFRLPLHLAVRAVPPPPVKPVVEEGRIEGGMSHVVSGVHRDQMNSLAQLAIERGTNLLGRRLNRQSSGSSICSSLCSESVCPATMAGSKMSTLTVTRNGVATYRFSDGVKLTVSYRGGSSSSSSGGGGSSSSGGGGSGTGGENGFPSSQSSISSSSSFFQHSHSHPHSQQRKQPSSYTPSSSPNQSALPILIPTLLDLYPEAASIPDDETGKFPLLSALESGKPYREAIEPLVENYPVLLIDDADGASASASASASSRGSGEGGSNRADDDLGPLGHRGSTSAVVFLENAKERNFTQRGSDGGSHRADDELGPLGHRGSASAVVGMAHRGSISAVVGGGFGGSGEGGSDKADDDLGPLAQRGSNPAVAEEGLTGLGGFLENSKERSHTRGNSFKSNGSKSSCGGGSTSSNLNFAKAIHASLMVALTSPNVVLRSETAYTVGYLMKGCAATGVSGGNGSSCGSVSGDGDTPPPTPPSHYYQSLSSSINQTPSYSSSASLNYRYQVDDFLRDLIKVSGRYGSAKARMGHVPSHNTVSSANSHNHSNSNSLDDEDDDPYRTRHRRTMVAARSLYMTTQQPREEDSYGLRNRRKTMGSVSSSSTGSAEEMVFDRTHNKRHSVDGFVIYEEHQQQHQQQHHPQHQIPQYQDLHQNLNTHHHRHHHHNPKDSSTNRPSENRNDEWSGIQSSMLRALSSAMTQAPRSTIRIPDTPKLALDAAYSMLRHEDAIVRDGAAQVVAAALLLLDHELGSVVIARVVLGQKGKYASTPAENNESGLWGAGRRVSKYLQNTAAGFAPSSSINIPISDDSGHSTSTLGSIASFTLGGTNTARTSISSSSTMTRGESSALANLGQSNIRISRPGSAAAIAAAATMEESVPVRHGRAVACYRILSSPAGEFLGKGSGDLGVGEREKDIFFRIRILVKTLMLDPSPTVRKAACLCVGPILSFASSENIGLSTALSTTMESGTNSGTGHQQDNIRERKALLPNIASQSELEVGSTSNNSEVGSTSNNSEASISSSQLSQAALAPPPPPDYSAVLRDLRPSIMKCMRTTEDPDVHLHLARGLISTARYHYHRNDGDNNHYFVTKVGTPILEGALMLASSSPVIAVRNLFGAFLWVALGMEGSSGVGGGGRGPGGRRGEGLAQYMELAEGENGKIMMGLVTKTLVRIESVRAGLR